MFTRFRVKFAASLFLAVALFAFTHVTKNSSVQAAEASSGNESLNNDKEDVTSVPGGDHGFKDGNRLLVTLPYSNQDGVPVAAILEDTHHSFGDLPVRLMAGKPVEFKRRRHSLQIRFALWTSGRIMWCPDGVRWYRDHIATADVKKLVASVHIKDCNSHNNMQYSYAGYRQEYYAVLFVSKGESQNVILCSPFHYFMRTGEKPRTYVYWNQAGNQEVFYDAKEYSWSQFSNQVPPDFLAYLRSWESLESTLRSVIPKATSSKELDMFGTTTLVSCVYEYKKGNPAQWVRLLPKQLHKLDKPVDAIDVWRSKRLEEEKPLEGKVKKE